MDYSTQEISKQLISEIIEAVQGVEYGSIEIYVQNKIVTQISVRNIKKTKANVNIKSNGNSEKKKIRVLTIEKQ